MNNELRTSNERRATRHGFTLIELVIATSAAMIVVLVVGSLLVSGQRSWARAFNYANSKPQLDALATTITFGAYGRKSNKMDYTLYEIVAGRFDRVPPPANPEEVVTGQAVEFHYWDTELNNAIMNISITGTAYALFYLDDDKLMLDLGPYPPGGVDAVGNRLSAAYVTTVTLAENVTALEFSHTTRNLNGDGKGCVRMSLTVTDPNDNSQTTITAATLMRNVWP
jgi:type II secretory pathway pseudopilin PulG